MTDINTTPEAEQTAAPEATQSAQGTTITTSTVQVQISGFSDAIEGKIDTGAEQSSLHAEEIEVTGDQVTFVFGERRYRTQVHKSQNISSADGGVQSRPVILVNLTVNGVEVPDIAVNLNDRADMPQKFLIGQDVIKAADFVIDLSDEETEGAEGTEAAQVSPEQEEVPAGPSSIAQLGDNPLAEKEPEATAGEVTFEEIKKQLEVLTNLVNQLSQKQ